MDVTTLFVTGEESNLSDFDYSARLTMKAFGFLMNNHLKNGSCRSSLFFVLNVLYVFTNVRTSTYSYDVVVYYCTNVQYIRTSIGEHNIIFIGGFSVVHVCTDCTYIFLRVRSTLPLPVAP